MYQDGIPKKARYWIIRFLLKAYLLILAVIFIFEGIFMANGIILVAGIFLLPFGTLLVRQDIKNDPYNLLQFYKVQFLLWNRLQGPIITRRPYNHHYPEGRRLQQYDVIRTLKVKKKDLIRGINKVIGVKIPAVCHKCGGKRNTPMTVQVECNRCKQGRQHNLIDEITITIPCSKCLGLGWIPVHPCETCKGKGSIWQNQRIKVNIPPHTKAGTKLRIPALGKVDVKTLQQGNLYIQVKQGFLDILH